MLICAENIGERKLLQKTVRKTCFSAAWLNEENDVEGKTSRKGGVGPTQKFSALK